MLPSAMSQPRRVLMTLDAVGGVWRYAIDLARELGESGIACMLVGLGPAPTEAQRQECRGLRDVTLTWASQPLDWMVEDESALHEVGPALLSIARDWDADLLHLNLPSQAAAITDRVPIVVAAHSCIATWWMSVKGDALPPAWCWQQPLNRRGLRRADAVMVPTASHGDALVRAYGPVERLVVVPNSTGMDGAAPKEPIVLAAGRWWDEGKNAHTLDEAAALSRWPVVMLGSLAGPNGQSRSLRHAVFGGELPHEATRGYMRRAAIFVSAALYEPFGLAVLEAAASGAALILSDIPTYRELWDEAALFVASRDAKGFAAAINDLVDNASLRDLLGKCARGRAAAFTVERQTDLTRRVYAEALAARQPIAAESW
jgi:glycosyltransferase involved in cell wall biosynthesis